MTMSSSPPSDDSSDSHVPIIDISPFVHVDAHDDSERAACAKAWDDAFSNVGFALIVGHGVSNETVEALRAGFRSFFEGTDASYKATFCHGKYGNPLGGYVGVGGEAVARSQDGHGGANEESSRTAPADPVENFVCRHEDFDDGTPCPKQPKEIRDAAAAYYKGVRRVLDVLNRITEAALKLPEGYFEPYYQPKPNCYVVAKYYPPNFSSALRYGAHTDYTGYTILKQDDCDCTSSGGLQVRLQSGEWKPVRPREDAFVVNLGDLYEDWTNGRWTSAVHRVVAPPEDSQAAKVSRLSMPFFTGPADEALIETLPTCVSKDNPSRLEAPIRAGDHLRRKLEATQV